MIKEDYKGLLYKLLPPGTAFTDDPDSNIMKLFDPIATELERLEETVYNVISEANPSTMVNTLPVRYEEAGLPDPCRGKPPTFQEQRNDVLTRWAAVGGSSKKYFENLGLTYGYIVEIFDRQYPMFQVDVSGIESTGIEDAWVYTWDVHYFDTSQVFFRAGQSLSGERLVSPALVDVTCLFERLKPAHTQIKYFAETDLGFFNTNHRIGTTLVLNSGKIY